MGKWEKHRKTHGKILGFIIVLITIMIGWVIHVIKTTGWWYTYPSEKYYSIGMTIPNIWKSKKWSKPPSRTIMDRIT